MNASFVRHGFARWGTLAAAALAVPLISPAAIAQTQEICIISPNNGEVMCGRAASRQEIQNSDYGRSWRNDRRGNREGRYDEDRYNTREVSNRRSVYDVYDQLDDIYVDVLGRNVDKNGLRTYTRKMERGWTLAEVRADLVDSSEAKTALDELYRRVLGRGVDPDGYRTYRRKIARGASLADVERELSKSSEARRSRR